MRISALKSGGACRSLTHSMDGSGGSDIGWNRIGIDPPCVCVLSGLKSGAKQEEEEEQAAATIGSSSSSSRDIILCSIQ